VALGAGGGVRSSRSLQPRPSRRLLRWGEALAYLDKRVAQLQYPSFQAAWWPPGSGTVESVNKLVVESRLKGAGMRWARPNVTTLLVLRNAVCNDRWHEAQAQSATWLRRRPLPRGRNTASTAASPAVLAAVRRPLVHKTLTRTLASTKA
jgi:hypothetical protein